MRTYAILARRGKLIWCIWSGFIAALPPRQPLFTLSLACAALLVGRTLGAADKVSSEKCRRFMAVAGAIGAIPIFALEILIVEANALVDFAAAEVAATAFALVGWICLALEFAHPEPNDDAALQSVVILGITFVVPLVLGLSFPAIGPWFPVFSACLGATASLVAQLLTRLSSGTDERTLFSLVAGLVFSASLYDTLSGCPHLALVLTGMHLFAVTVVILYLIRHASPCTRPPPKSRQIPGKKSVRAPASSGFSPPCTPSTQWSREAEVLISTAIGKPRRIIAQELGISESTVNTNRSRGYEKLGIRSRKNSAFSSLLHSRAMMSNLITQAKTQHQSTVDLHSCTTLEHPCLYRVLPCIYLVSIRCEQSTCDGTLLWTRSHLWCSHRFSLPSRFRRRGGPSTTALRFPFLGKKPPRGYRNDTLPQCFWWRLGHFCGSFASFHC